MVDLQTQYKKMASEVNAAVQEVIDNAQFINGPAVKEFQKNLEEYLDVAHVIPCGNGTDALQVALMALDLEPDAEIIVPAFTFVATVEVIALLGFKPVVIDVHPDEFNLDPDLLEGLITEKTRAVMPVHLFGQCSDMERINEIAAKHNLYVIEDNAQSIGARYRFSDGSVRMAGSIGTISTTSFYPSKNLGAYGDGGAIATNDDVLGQKIRMVCNHGMIRKYYHEIIGVNSRLDAIQAAILNVKMKYLDDYHHERSKVAEYYDQHLADLPQLKIPGRHNRSTHVFHQYTLQLNDMDLDDFKSYLMDRGIPTMIYYPVALHKQKAFAELSICPQPLTVTERLCETVLSLPMHTELDTEVLDYICSSVHAYFK